MVDTISADRGPYNLSSGDPLQQQQEPCATGSEALAATEFCAAGQQPSAPNSEEDCVQTLALLSPEHRQQLRQRAEGAYTDAIIDWLVRAGYIRSITHQEAISDFCFSRAKQTQTGGILICHNPQAKQPHYQLRCDNPPRDEKRNRPAKYLMQSAAGEQLAVWDPSGLQGPDGTTIGQARTGTEGFFDALYATLVLGTPCMAITAPSHLRTLKLPDHLQIYLGDCDQWMAPNLLPMVVHGCVSKGLKLARLPLLEVHRTDYLKPHSELPGAAKGGMEELGEHRGVEDARQILEAVVSTARAPGDYLRWEIKELAELGLCWPAHHISITNLTKAIADAYPNNQIGRDALKEEIVAAIPHLGASTVRSGIKDRLLSKQQQKREEWQRRREKDRAEALARGETPAPEIDRDRPTNQQLQQFIDYAYAVRLNELTRLPEINGKPVSDVTLTYQLLADSHDINAPKAAAQDALIYVAQANPYNPVAEYLEGVRRDASIEPLPAEAIFQMFGLNPADLLSQDLLQRSLVGSVKRGLAPGCKFDACPILRGRQGNGKTEILRALATPAWYDGLGDYGSSADLALSGWKVMAKVNASWLFELGEVERLTQGRCQSAFKDWLSERVAKYAEKYQPLATEHPRRFVTWGTTNEQELLNDETGSRRFWIIECTGTILWQEAAEQRDRVWKAALIWMEQGVESWLNPATEAGAAATQASAERGLEATFTDPWGALLLEYLVAVGRAHGQRSPAKRLELARSGKGETLYPAGDGVQRLRLRYIPIGHRSSEKVALFVTMADLHDALDVKPAQQGKHTSARIGRVMGYHQILEAGWRKSRSKKVGSRGFARLLPPAGGDGRALGTDSSDSEMGPKDPDGESGSGVSRALGADSPDWGMGPKNLGGKSASGLGPILLEGEKVIRGNHSSCTAAAVEMGLSNRVMGNAAPRMGPSPDPPLAEGSRGSLPNRDQDNGPENGSQAAAETGSPAPTGPVVKSNHQRKAKAAAVQLPPPVAIPVPRPYVGAAPPGIAYIHRAQDLPEPKGLPLAVGFDLETWNRRTDIWRHKASLFPFLGGEIRLAQISDGHQSLVVDVALIGAAAIDWLRVLARDPERTLVGHNLLFEATYLISLGIRPLCKWWDTMLASQTIGEYPDNTLAAVARNYLGEELDKAEQTGDWGNEITASQLRYAAADSLKALQARGPLAARLEETGQTEAHRADCLMISAAADGQHRGLGIDVARLDEMEAAASAAWQAKRTTLYQMLELPVPPADAKHPYRHIHTLHHPPDP